MKVGHPQKLVCYRTRRSQSHSKSVTRKSWYVTAKSRSVIAFESRSPVKVGMLPHKAIWIALKVGHPQKSVCYRKKSICDRIQSRSPAKVGMLPHKAISIALKVGHPQKSVCYRKKSICDRIQSRSPAKVGMLPQKSRSMIASKSRPVSAQSRSVIAKAGRICVRK